MVKRAGISLVLSILAVSFQCLPLFADEVKLDVSANRDQIYLGESINLTVKVSGTDSAPDPDLSELENCSIKFLGSHSDSRHSVMIVNGKMTRESFVGRIYSYDITPNAAGKFAAGPVKLTLNGRMISQPGPVIDVQGVETQKGVLVAVTSSRDAVLVDEPFDVTVTIALKRLGDPYADAHPLDPNEPPTLTIPFLENQPIDGLDGRDVVKFLNEHVISQNRGPGFAVNKYTIRGNNFPPMPGFNFDDFFRDQDQTAKFMFDRQVVQTNGESYLQYSFTLRYSPREEGNYTFGPALFKGKVVIDADAQGRATTRPVFAVGPACTVRVVPPPETGRPTSYIGAIGSNLMAEATLDTQTCNVGDPLTLTLKVSGNISMDNIFPPILSAQESLARTFKVYDDTVQIVKKDGAKEFVYTVRPQKDGTIELPAIDVSYYDSTERKYRTAKTKPIPIRANKAASVGSEIIIATATNRAAETKEKQAEMSIPAPLNVDPAGAEPAEIIGNRWLLIPMVAGPVLFLLTISMVYARRYVERNSDANRRRNAIKKAIPLLKEAEYLARKDAGAARRRLCGAVRMYMADRFDASGAGLTPGDMRRILAEHAVEQHLIDPLCEIVERNFNAEYGGTAARSREISADSDRLRELLAQIDERD